MIFLCKKRNLFKLLWFYIIIIVGYSAGNASPTDWNKLASTATTSRNIYSKSKNDTIYPLSSSNISQAISEQRMNTDSIDSHYNNMESITSNILASNKHSHSKSVNNPAVESIALEAVRLISQGLYYSSTTRNQKNNADDDNLIKNLHPSVIFHNIGEFKEYYPKHFQNLRNHAGISEERYLSSINPDRLQCINSDSKSGQAFWKSNDNVLIVKTIKHYECINLRKITEKFTQHVLGHPHTTISAVLGCYRIKLKKNNKKVYFIIMKNVYYYKSPYIRPPLFANSNVSTYFPIRYDLKGSTIGRYKSPASSVMKDLDLIRSQKFFKLGSSGKSILLETLTRDVEFLSSLWFMDYSLLVEVEASQSSYSHARRFIHRLIQPVSTSLMDRGKLVLLGNDGFVYHFGIIDFLQ
eukprot:gene15675-21204_t